jgi:excisionase family DNA binding protein
MDIYSESLANSIPDVCRRLSIGRSTVYELINSRQLKTIKVGQRTLIPESELRRFVAERLAEPGAGHASAA